MLGAIAAAVVLYVIVSGAPGFEGVGGFASNGYGEASPEGYSMMSALVIEIVLTAFFLVIILGATSSGAPAGFAPIAIGLALTLIHLISIPVTNTSVNPARSTGVALFADGPALAQAVAVLGRPSDWGSNRSVDLESNGRRLIQVPSPQENPGA